MQLPCLQFGCIIVPFYFILNHLEEFRALSRWQSAEKATECHVSNEPLGRSDGPVEAARRGARTQARARSHRLPLSPGHHAGLHYGAPHAPPGPPRLSSLSQKGMVFFLNAGLVGNLCGLAVRKQKLIIRISGPEGAVVCRVDASSGFQTQNSPGAFGQAVDSVVLGDSCSESRNGKWLAWPRATCSLLICFVWAVGG